MIEGVRRLYFAKVFANLVCGFQPDGRVLEAGCGSGKILRYLKAKGRYRTVGCDYSVEAIHLARIHCDAIVACDIAQLPFGNDSFSLVFNQGVMEHFPPAELDNVLREFQRVSSKILLVLPSSTSVFRLCNPFGKLDAYFFSRDGLSSSIARTFSRAWARYLPATLWLSVVGYGER